MNTKSSARLLVEAFLRDNPESSLGTAARSIYAAHPLEFKNTDHALTFIRQVRGVLGARNRKKTDKSLFTKSAMTKLESELASLPAQKSEYDYDWKPLQIEGSQRVLVLPDIHIPYHDVVALKTALQYGIKYKPTIVLLNGDTIDFYTCSRWETRQELRDLAGEVRATRDVLRVIRSLFPEARIIYKMGNHDERWEAYLRNKAPELIGMEEFKLDSVLQFSQHNIEYVGDGRVIRIGTLNMLHGHEHKGGMITNPVNPARGLFLRTKSLSMCFPAGTTVFSGRGIVGIETVQVGDTVLTRSGAMHRVKRVMSRSAETVVLKGLGHPRLVVTPDHPILTSNAIRNSDETIAGVGEAEWTEASKTAGRYWYSPCSFPSTTIPEIESNHHVGPYRSGFEYKVAISVPLMELVGRWLGDGFCSGGNIVVVDSKDKECELRQLFNNAGLKPFVSYKGSCVVASSCRKALVRWIRKHFGYYAEHKTLPAWAFGMEEEYRNALLKGYLASDGHVPKDNSCDWECTSISRQLAVGIKLLSQSLGYSTTMFMKKSGVCVFRNQEYISKEAWIVKGIKHYKRWSKSIRIEKHLLGRIRNVDHGKREIVYNIEVEEDNSFIADGIIVHNCSHFHQVSQHSERTAEGKIMSCWSTGCLCQLNPRYRPYNNWGHGFATVTLHDGEFEVENKRIIEGKVY